MNLEQFSRSLQSGATELGIPITDDAIRKLHTYYTELQRWNRKVNLVSRHQPDWVRIHFLDSLVPLGLDLVVGDERAVDLGAGAGFPGVPLKVASPGLAMDLVEASGKKCAWLNHIARTLKLEGARVLEGRFQELLDGGAAGRYDLAVSRAAAKPKEICKLAARFLAPEGRVLIYTTKELTERGVGKVHRYTVPGSKVPSVIWEVQAGELD